MLTIGQLARAAGSTAKTIRYYEHVGVLPRAPRNESGYRQYSRADVDRLMFVRRARALGLSLADLKALVGDLEGERCAAMRPRLRALVSDQLRLVHQRIDELRSLERELAEIHQRLMMMTDTRSPRPNGCGNLAVDCGADHWPTGDFHGHRADLKLKLRPAQNGCGGRRKSAAHRRCGEERAGSGYPLNEAAAAYRAYGCVIVVGHRRPPPAGVIDWITYIPPSPCSTVKLTRVPGFTACKSTEGATAKSIVIAGKPIAGMGA